MSDPPHIVFSGLLPHPPIIVPAVGGDRGADCRATTDACRALAERIVAARPARLFLVSPHSPRQRRSYGIWAGERLRGDLGAFGHSAEAVDLPNDLAVAELLAIEAKERRVATWSISDDELDHGAVVPLWFLVQAGWAGPTCIASLPHASDPRSHAAFGNALAASVASVGGGAALVASGDMSHRLAPGAPGGFDPRALELDEPVCAAVERGDPADLAGIDPGLRAVAAEDVVDSCGVVVSATPLPGLGVEILSYEHPFGVGYLVAVFHDPGSPS